MNKYIFNNKEEKRLMKLFDHDEDSYHYSIVHYLSEDTYIEKTPIQNSYFYIIYNHRINKSDIINKNIFNNLKKNSLLTIQKRIYQKPKDIIRISVIEKPLNLCIIETPDNQENLRECRLSYWNLFKRFITIGGTFGVGKTEFAKGLSYILNTQFGATSIYVSEYATDFIQKNGSDIKYSDQLIIYNNQKKKEINAAKTLNICISDCPTFLSYIYALFIPSKDKKNIMNELYSNVLCDTQNYTDIAIILSHGQDVPDNNIRETYKPKQIAVEETIIRFLDHNSIECSYVRRDMINRYIDDLFFINRVDDLNV